MPQSHAMIAVAASILFVLIWSTGFVVARGVVPHASPELFLSIRLPLTALLLGLIALLMGQALPKGRQLILHLIAGAMLIGLYLTVSWWAVDNGMPAGIMSLLGALQPLLVALMSVAFLGERPPSRTWAGLAIAILGVACVLLPAIQDSGAAAVQTTPIIAGFVAVIAMAGGTVIQRGSISGDGIWISGAVQNVGGALVAIAATFVVGEYRWDNSLTLWAGMAWSVLGMSAGGVSLLVWLVRTQGPTRPSMMLLLVPPIAAIEAWLLFGEQLGPIQIAGFALALGGVLLGRSQGRRLPLTEPA